MNVADYQSKSYPKPPCWALVCDVLATERGEVPYGVKTVSGTIRTIASAFRLELHKSAHGFEQIQEPEDFAVVLMGRTPRTGIHHCGIYYDGKVLHAMPDGVLYQDLASLRDEYPLMEFWTKAGDA